MIGHETPPVVNDPCQKALIYAVTNFTLVLPISQYTCATPVAFGSRFGRQNAPVVNIKHMSVPIVAAMPVSVQMSEEWIIGSFLEAMQRQVVNVIPSGQPGSEANFKIG